MKQRGQGLGGRLGHIAARLGPGTGRFFGWWGRSLAAWLPAGVRTVLGMDRGRLLLQVDGEDLQVFLQQADAWRDLGRIPLAGLAGSLAADPFSPLLGARLQDLPRWLLLPATSGLRRRINLPAAAADRLRDVVGFEVDRQTPFAADAVAYDARLLGRRDADGQLDVELVVVPREVLDPQLAVLGPLAATLAGIDMAEGRAPDGDVSPLGVNLLPVSRRRRSRDPWAVGNAALAAVAVIALVALLWQLLDSRWAGVQRLEQQIADQSADGRNAAAQRQQLARLVEGQRFLDGVRAGQPTATEIIDGLSRRLPDDAYLEKLSINGNQILLIGLSSKAAALVGQLQDAGPWRSPALAGALQPDPESGRDRFTLVATTLATTVATTHAAPAAVPEQERADAPVQPRD